MVIFQGLTEDRKGINISLLYESDIEILAKIIDGYSGVCSYATRMVLNPGFVYYFSHFVGIYHRRFEVWNKEGTELFLKVDVLDDKSPNLQVADIFGNLRNFKYSNFQDFDAALPLYEIFINNLYDKPHCKINPGDVVFDIGGNIGLFSYFAICKKASKVYCFEPSQDSVKTIRDNFDFPNLIVEESAVSAKNGEVTFYYNTNSSIQSSLYTPEIGTGVVCKSINLYDYIVKNNIPKIDYLKLDCEGSEYEIIETIPFEYLANNVNKMCVEFHFNTDGRLFPMLNKLKDCGFHIEAEGGGDIKDGELGVFYAWK